MLPQKIFENLHNAMVILGFLNNFQAKFVERNYFNGRINTAQHNSGLNGKQLMVCIIKFKNTKHQDIFVLKNDNDILVDNPSLVSNLFNDYFANLGQNMANKIPNSSSKLLHSPTSL